MSLPKLRNSRPPTSMLPREIHHSPCASRQRTGCRTFSASRSVSSSFRHSCPVVTRAGDSAMASNELRLSKPALDALLPKLGEARRALIDAERLAFGYIPVGTPVDPSRTYVDAIQ